MNYTKYNIIDEYKTHCENFNLTGDDKYAIYISDYSDYELKKELDNLIDNEKIHCREEWLFVFKHAYSNRRKEKLKKLSVVCNDSE